MPHITLEFSMNKSHLTAINRYHVSAPMRFLFTNGFLGGRMLDYGCGKGFDATALRMHKYDPYWHNFLPRGRFDTITCNYVLNVLPEGELQEVFNRLDRYLRDDGMAYITVRRDVKRDGYTSRGTYQRNVELDLPVLHETSSYCIYIYNKGDYNA